MKQTQNKHFMNMRRKFKARPNVNLEVAKTISKLIAFPVRPEIRENVN